MTNSNINSKLFQGFEKIFLHFITSMQYHKHFQIIKNRWQRTVEHIRAKTPRQSALKRIVETRDIESQSGNLGPENYEPDLKKATLLGPDDIPEFQRQKSREWESLNNNHGQVTSKNEQLLARIKELQENLIEKDEKNSEKDAEISELKARLRYYEEDLGFRKGGGDMPRLKRLNYMLGIDF